MKREITVDENLIHSLVFDLTLPSTVEKDKAIPETEACFERYALTVIDEVVTHYGFMYDCDIEQISVDLGTVSKEELPAALKSALEDAIIRHLYVSQGEGTELIQKHGSAQDAGIARDVNTSVARDVNTSVARDVNTSVARDVNTSVARDVNTSVAKDVNTSVAKDVNMGGAKTPFVGQSKSIPLGYMTSEPTWMSYLFTGIVPWNYDVLDDQLSERVWNGVSALLGQSPQLQAFLSRLSNDVAAVYRLVNLLDDNKLLDVIKAILHLGVSKGNALSIKIAQTDMPQLADLKSIALSSSDALLQLDSRLDRSTLSLLLYSLLESIGEDEGYGQLDERLKATSNLKSIALSSSDALLQLDSRLDRSTLFLLLYSLLESIGEDEGYGQLDERLKATSNSERHVETQDHLLPAIKSFTDLNDEQSAVETRGALDRQHSQENMMDESSVSVTDDSQLGDEPATSSGETRRHRKSSSAIMDSDEAEAIATPSPKVEKRSTDEEVRQKDELPMLDMLQSYETEMIERKQMLTDAPTPQGMHWMVDDAGLIILHPFLPTLFDCLGLLDEERQFVGLEAQEKAVHLLRWMAGFDAPHRDYQLALEKMLCGLPLAYPIEPFFELSDEEIDEGRQVLESVCQNWPPLKGTSVEGLQQSFMRRAAFITYEDNTWIVRVEGLTIDILLDDLPWEISLLLLPWKKDLIMVEWQRE